MAGTGELWAIQLFFSPCQTRICLVCARGLMSDVAVAAIVTDYTNHLCLGTEYCEEQICSFTFGTD